MPSPAVNDTQGAEKRSKAPQALRSGAKGPSKVRWYLSRLASMQPAEMAWRARSAARIPLDWAEWKKQAAAPAPRWRPFDAATYPVQLHGSQRPMDKLRVFDLEFPLGFDFDWHRDYRYGRQVERGFAGSLNIRDTAIVSDIKYVWEPSRFQHLSALAHASNGRDQADYIVRSIDSWLRSNPYLTGVHWTSSLELAERLISWALLYPCIAEKITENAEFRARWLNSIYLHMVRISRKLSFYSSANNHLIGELIGLFVGASCFAFWPECAGWRERAQKLLEQEILLQVGEDGVNREQAMSYHLFTMELFLLAFAIGRKAGQPFSADYAERLRGMGSFVDAIATTSGDVPWYGDSDDARGFLLSEEESGVEVAMQLAGLLLNEPHWLRFSKGPTQAAQALVPDLLPKLAESGTRSHRSRELFPNAGLVCVKTENDRIRLLMDFGPLGFPAPAGHGHADALSIWMAIDEEYFLVDAGTYAYHSHPEWREYFRSTAAHNTARVDGKDQSEMAGRFLWSAKANARLLRFENDTDRVSIEAEHDGYSRLASPVVHRRMVSFDRLSGNVSIADEFRGSGRHQVELFFHLHEEAEIAGVTNCKARVHWRGHEIVFTTSDPTSRWEVFRGSENPKLGWRSLSFNQKHPTPTLRIRAEVDGSTIIRTDLRID